MRIDLLPVGEQVIVITGASSGSGFVTAKQAAQRGACVVLSARNGDDLARAVEEIRHEGGRAVHITADVADPHQVETIAEAAIRAFGRIDTWVNNAAVSMYGRVNELSTEDMRRQMDINFWGQVYGSRVAVKHLRARGGAVINVGSALPDRAILLQGVYCAAKHALKAFTDTLRMELEDEGAPISVTLVKPASAGELEDVAGGILRAAQSPLRELIAGRRGARWRGHTRASSVYTKAMLHPAATVGIAAASTVALAGAAWRVFARRRKPAPDSAELEYGLS